MKRIFVLMIAMVALLLCWSACGEDIASVPKNDDAPVDNSSDPSMNLPNEEVACSYAEFRPCILTFDSTQSTLAYEKMDTKEQINAFIARYEEAIADEYARFEGIEGAVAQTKVQEEEAKKVFEIFTEDFFEKNVLYLIALPVSAVRFDLAGVEAVTEPDKEQLTITIGITNIESTADENELSVSTVAVWINREVAQTYEENVVIIRTNT